MRCNKAVYGANQACQAMGSLYHDSCFTCSACSKYTHPFKNCIGGNGVVTGCVIHIYVFEWTVICEVIGFE